MKVVHNEIKLEKPYFFFFFTNVKVNLMLLFLINYYISAEMAHSLAGQTIE